MRRSRTPSRSEAVSMDQNEERGTRGSRWRQQESKSRFISRKNYERSIGKKRKRLLMLISWQISEGNFTTFVWIPVLPNAWIRTVTPYLRNWRSNCWTLSRPVSFIRASAIEREPALHVSGQPW